MIIGIRCQHNPLFSGIQMLYSRDWIQPIEELSKQCFASFDECLHRLSTDPQATQISAIEDPEDKELSRFNSALLSAQRGLPEKYRNQSTHFCIALSEGSTGRGLWCRIPAWIDLYLENMSGELDAVEVNGGEGNSWFRVDLLPEDSWLHLGFFGRSPQINFNRNIPDLNCRSAQLLSGQVLQSFALPLAIKNSNKNLHRFQEIS